MASPLKLTEGQLREALGGAEPSTDPYWVLFLLGVTINTLLHGKKLPGDISALPSGWVEKIRGLEQLVEGKR